ncbi:ATP-dependent nuclease [Chryseobacterium shigense]|uniref:AAA15 family ATPase/GTPase n=1 Tax=Chryseobacterium shigense TaxID=297244 RepID=A0A841NNE4_9FLAO|nr:AAA family ATPase [Chryseobacterium shigense]MBB6372255.1 AAA15 family ATPase/GTPase [Chryseobacterium shigense]
MNQHIQNIAISNFKSIKDLKIDGCKKINIFAGKPNAGKSNILEALGGYQFLKNQSHRRAIDIKTLNEYIRFEALQDIFYESNISEEISIGINQIDLNFDYNDFSETDLYEISINSQIEKKGEELITHIKESEHIKYYKFKLSDDNKNNYLKYLNYPFGENIGNIISQYTEIRSFVNKFLAFNKLKLLIEKNTNELKIFKEYEDGTVFTLPYNMIADTLQRLIFYKTAIMSNQDSVLLFEEPEAHCFEPYILEFTNEVKFNENNNQFFMVTHSDFIIQEFLRDEESKNNLQIYLVNNVDGKTEVKKLQRENNDDVYEYGMNVFFNFDSLWNNN